MLQISALTDYAEQINGSLWLTGNRNLVVLNLSSKFKVIVTLILFIYFLKFKGNFLTEKSVSIFVMALQNQKIILDSHKNPNGTGLMRLILQVCISKLADNFIYIRELI